MDQELSDKANVFCKANGLVLREQLGFGIHGGVWVAEDPGLRSQFALKILYHETFYLRERDAYLRLEEHGVSEICGCDVPALVGCDDGSHAIMLTIVSRPYVLDFAGSRLDAPEEFPEETLRQFFAEKEIQFGKDWAKAREIVSELETYGIFLTDITPNNIAVRSASRTG